MIKIARREITLPLLLFLISFILWKHIPSLQFAGEGFYYFAEYTVGFSLGDKIPHDMFARLLFTTLPRWFGSSVHLYMWVLLFVMLLIDLVMYIFIRMTTGNKFVAFLVALLFSLSYIGKYDMYSVGGYQYFLQRAVTLLPHLLALMFLNLYFLRNFSIKYYFLSLSLYLLGVLMGFFGTWFLPPFLFFPLFYLIFHHRDLKRIFLKTFWTPFPFLLGNILIIKHSSFYSYPGDESFLSFLSHFFKIFSGLVHQLGVVTLPIGGYKWLLDNLPLAIGRDINNDYVMVGLGIFLIVLYLLAFILIWKFSPNWKAFAVASFVSLIFMFLFNLYKNSATVLVSSESSRYFYFPFTMVALFWGIFLASIFSSRGLFNKFLVAVFCLLWIFHNSSAIQKAVKIDQWQHKANQVTINFLRSHATYLRENPSYVYLPANLGSYGAGFAFRYFSHPDGKFRLQGFEDLDLFALARERVDPEKLYVLYFDPRQQIVIDKTEESRALLRDIKQKNH